MLTDHKPDEEFELSMAVEFGEESGVETKPIIMKCSNCGNNCLTYVIKNAVKYEKECTCGGTLSWQDKDIHDIDGTVGSIW